MKGWSENLSELIKNPKAVTILRAEEYPSLFITWLLDRIKKESRSVVILDVTSTTLSDIQLQLSSPFLGNAITYWLRAVEELDAAQYKQFYKFITAYKGPHTILFFLPKGDTYGEQGLHLPAVLTYEYFLDLAFFHSAYLKERSAVTELIRKIFEKYKTMSVEQAMLIMEYLPLVGKSATAFIQEWVPQILVSEQSLFALSQAFFAKNQQQCLLLWHQIQDQYGEQFWTAYWSEQLFRAYFVAKALHTQDKTIDIRRLSARLPFSFIKRDYKRWKLQELAAAHEYITRIELDLKSGASSWQLDTFYLKTLTL